MSSLLNPVGPEPANVYWRRRIVVILGVLVVLGLLWWLISPGGSSAPTTAVSSSPTALPTLSATASPSPDGSATGSPSASVSGAECLDSDIVVTVTTAQQSYSLGEPIEFVMKISNTGTTACKRDVGPAANTFTVTSGGFGVWSSDACTATGDSQEEEIPVGEAFAVKGTWDGTVTANGCGPSATPAEAGSYQVEATNGQVTSDPVGFTLG